MSFVCVHVSVFVYVCVYLYVFVCVGGGCFEEKGSVCPSSFWSQMLWKALALSVTARALRV